MVRALLLALALSSGPVVANAFARFAYALVLPAMRADLDWSWAQAGWLNTANAAGYLAGAVLTRLLVVRLGNRPIFQWGLLVTALAILATGLTRDLGLLSLARAIAGVSGAAVFICGGALAANVWPQRPSFATTSITVYIGAAGIGIAPVAIARLWRSFLKCETARSVNSGRLPPLTTVSPSGVTSRLSLAWSCRR